jgi:hypothetical protein
MAYIDAATTKKIRVALKEKFPKVKFRVSKSGHLSLNVSVDASPYFEDGDIKDVNPYWVDKNYEGEQRDFLQGVLSTIKTAGEWYDKSDIMTDYFDTAFYYHINIGGYGRPHKKV